MRQSLRILYTTAQAFNRNQKVTFFFPFSFENYQNSGRFSIIHNIKKEAANIQYEKSFFQKLTICCL